MTIPDPQPINILLNMHILIENLIELIFKHLNFLGEMILAMKTLFLPLEFNFEIFDLIFKLEVFLLELKVPDVRAGRKLVVLRFVVVVGLAVVSDEHLLDDVVDLEV